MKKLKRQSILMVLPLTIILLVIGIFILVAGINNLSKSEEEPTILSEVDFSKDISGLYVTADVSMIYLSYGEITENNVAQEYEYLIDANDEYYIGLRIEVEDKEPAEKLLEASYNYVVGDIDESEWKKASFTIKGTIHKMEDEMVTIYHESVGWDKLSASEQATFLPYYIALNEGGEELLGGGFIGLILGIIFIGIALIRFFYTACTALDEFNSCISDSPNAEYTRLQIEMFLKNTPDIAGFKCDSNYVCGRNYSKIAFGETDKLVWVYHHVVRRRVYFITVTSNEVVLCFKNGEKQFVHVDNESNATEIIQKLITLCPKCIFGYSDQLDRLYQYPKKFLELKYSLVESATSEQNY